MFPSDNPMSPFQQSLPRSIERLTNIVELNLGDNEYGERCTGAERTKSQVQTG